jgi:integrase
MADQRIPPEIAEYYLRTPSTGRAGYRLIRRARRAGARSISETIPNEAIAAVNARLRAGDMTPAEAKEAAYRELLRVRRRERRAKIQTLRPANLRLLERYWAEVYSHKDIVAPASAKGRLRRAVEALGDVPLTADATQIQQAVNTALKDKPGRQRDVVAALTQILRWMGRTDVRLSKAKKPTPRVRYLTLSDFAVVAAQIPDVGVRTAAWVGVSTGCRLGEVFALEQRAWRATKRTVWVDAQIKYTGQAGPPKNRRAREAPVLAVGVPHIERWVAMPSDEKQALRKQRFSDIIRRACKRAFPNDPSKHIVFHDLRHSYAIHLLSAEVPMELVAQALGDSIIVTQEFYTGFCLVDQGVATVRRLLDAAAR